MKRTKKAAPVTKALAEKIELASILRNKRTVYNSSDLDRLFKLVDPKRVETISKLLSKYVLDNLPKAIDRRNGIEDYRTNPYVLLATANVMKLSNPSRLADFLFNNKFYMGLETSFGKSIESVLMSNYPLICSAHEKWEDPMEKIAEFALLKGLTRQDKMLKRNFSVWREIDRSCVINKRRYLLTIKSGPNCINDTQVEGMRNAIEKHHKKWLEDTKNNYKGVNELDIVIGLTYGTDSTTNNKENQILTKLLGCGFEEEDRDKNPGVLIDIQSRSIRVYRVIGREYWSFVGNPIKPKEADHVFLEVLLSLGKALSQGVKTPSLESKLNTKIRLLAVALQELTLPDKSLPSWISKTFQEDELFWIATALTSFHDQGI